MKPAGGGEGPETKPLLSCLLALSGTTAVLNFIFYYYLLFIYLVFCQKQISPIIILFFLFHFNCMKGEVLKKRRDHRLVEPQIQDCDCPGHGQQQPFQDNQYP